MKSLEKCSLEWKHSPTKCFQAACNKNTIKSKFELPLSKTIAKHHKPHRPEVFNSTRHNWTYRFITCITRKRPNVGSKVWFSPCFRSILIFYLHLVSPSAFKQFHLFHVRIMFETKHFDLLKKIPFVYRKVLSKSLHTSWVHTDSTVNFTPEKYAELALTFLSYTNLNLVELTNPIVNIFL